MPKSTVIYRADEEVRKNISDQRNEIASTITASPLNTDIEICVLKENFEEVLAFFNPIQFNF
jgi:hypothetical protein